MLLKVTIVIHTLTRRPPMSDKNAKALSAVEIRQ